MRVNIKKKIKIWCQIKMAETDLNMQSNDV